MDKETKLRLDEAFESALKWHLKRTAAESIDSETEPPGSNSASMDSGPESRDTATVEARLAQSVKAKLEKMGIWTQVQSQLALDAIAEMARKRFDKMERERIDAAQMTLPGFDHLPKRIGKRGVADVSLREFFAYRDKYLKRADREKARVDQLQAVAEKVLGIYARTPEMRLADAIAKAEAPKETRPFVVKGASA